MGTWRALALFTLVACRSAPRSAPAKIVPPSVGIEISLYPGEPTVAWVEERRWLEITDKTLSLPRGGETTSIAQLSIEPLAGSTLRIGTCTSDPATAARGDKVRCSVEGPIGKHLVRVRYTMQAELAMEHDIVFRASGTATIVSSLRFTPPAWQDDVREAQIVVFDRSPEGGVPPTELARAVVPLDGAETVIVTPARTVPARFQRTVNASEDVMFGRVPVQTQLVLPEGELTTGSARVAFDGTKERRIASGLHLDGKRTIFDLGVDLQMSGMRMPEYDGRNGEELLKFEVVNDSDEARDVWITHHVGNAPYRVSGGLKTVRSNGDIRFLLPVPANSRSSVMVAVGQTP